MTGVDSALSKIEDQGKFMGGGLMIVGAMPVALAASALPAPLSQAGNLMGVTMIVVGASMVTLGTYEHLRGKTIC